MMLTTLLALATIQGAPLVGFTKADCVLNKIRNTPSLLFTDPVVTGETDLYRYAELKTHNTATGEFPRWVKIRGIKASSSDRTVTVVITQSLETACTMAGQYDTFRVQTEFPRFYVDVTASGWVEHVTENKTYSFALPAGATTAKLKCDTPWLYTLKSGSVDMNATATLRSYVKSYEVTTP